MTRFFGKIGYEEKGELVGGVWSPKMLEVDYYGDVVDNRRSLNQSDQVNDGVSVSNEISVVADSYAIANYINIKYIFWNEVRWIVTSVSVQRPRLVFSLGGVYNGPVPKA